MTDHLREAAAARHADCDRRARAALADLIKTEQPINFQAVARAASVSTDFLYAHPQLRTRIEQHRTVGRSGPPASERPDDVGTSGAVRALTAQIKALRATHRAEVARLEAALAAAQGESLGLRRRLASPPETLQHFRDEGRTRPADGKA